MVQIVNSYYVYFATVNHFKKEEISGWQESWLSDTGMLGLEMNSIS